MPYNSISILLCQMYFYVFSFCFYFTQNYYVSFISILKIIIYKQLKKIPVHTAKTPKADALGLSSI